MSEFEIYLRNLNKSVIQFNYEFHLVPYFNGDIQSVEDLKYSLEKSLEKKFHIECLNTYLESIYGLQSKLHNEENKHHSNFPYEICFKGCTRSLVSKNYKIFSDFNYEKYQKSKDDFIKENPNYKDKVNFLFDFNIKVICTFYLITEKQLRSNKFNRLEQSIKRLNIKINRYATS